MEGSTWSKTGQSPFEKCGRSELEKRLTVEPTGCRILYNWLTGQCPFSGSSVNGVHRQKDLNPTSVELDKRENSPASYLLLPDMENAQKRAELGEAILEHKKLGSIGLKGLCKFLGLLER